MPPGARVAANAMNSNTECSQTAMLRAAPAIFTVTQNNVHRTKDFCIVQNVSQGSSCAEWLDRQD